MADPKPSLSERLLAGDKRALARGISLVEDDDAEGWELVREIYPHTGRAAVVGITVLNFSLTWSQWTGLVLLLITVVSFARHEQRAEHTAVIPPSQLVERMS